MAYPFESIHPVHRGAPVLSRRKFVTIGSGALLCAGFAPKALQATATPDVIRRTSKALGTKVSITVLHRDRTTGERAIESAFDEIERVERVMSIYRSDSQVSVLNQSGEVIDPDPLFIEVMREAEKWSRRSSGAFDVTVQPLWNLFQGAVKRRKMPEPHEIQYAREKVDWRQIEISESRIRLKISGSSVTLNGIAQGFATDRAQDCLRNLGVEHALVDCGEIGAVGLNAEGNPWTAGIQHPRDPDAFISVAEVTARALATSGDYATTFTPDFRSNHLFNPRTGESPAEVASVTVAAPKAVEADALSTALFVLGPEEGGRLLKTTPGIDAFFVLKNGRTIATKGFPWSG